MISKLKLALAGFLILLVSSAATASLITFDGVDGEVTAPYTESGFIFELNVGINTHFGDGSSFSNKLDWHNGGNNPTNAIATMTKVGGGLFNLDQLDVIVQQSGTSLLINGMSYGSGTHSVNLFAVSAVTFDWTYAGGSMHVGAIDNLYVSEVSEPGVIFLLGIGIAAFWIRRRKNVRA